MTQGTPEGHDEAVRRLLAESGAPEPLPPDVAARLDATLARLVEQRDEIGIETEEPQREAQVVPLRRQRWPKLLLAAAAVVVAGYGLSILARNGSLSGVSSRSGDNATSGLAASAHPQQESKSDSQGSASGAVPGPAQLHGSAPVPLHPGNLPAEVHGLLGASDTVRLPKGNGQPGGAQRLEAMQCAPDHLPAGSTWLPATYDGRPAVLVIGPARRAAEGHSVVAAEVRSCNGRLLDSATVRAP